MSTNIEKGKPNPDESGEKKFTQAEVDAIISKRLSEEKRKTDAGKGVGSDEYDEKLQELQRRELELTAREVLTERGLPLELAKTLKYDSKDTLLDALKSVEEVIQTSGNKYKPVDTGKLPEGNPDAKINDLRNAFGLK